MDSIFKKAESTITPLMTKYKKLAQVFQLLRESEKVETYLEMANNVLIGRLGFNDHGETHSRIVCANAMLMLGMLNDAGIKPHVVKERIGNFEDALVVTLVGAYLHDVGNSIQREGHYMISVGLAEPIIEEMLEKVYPEFKKREKLKLMALECIHNHDESQNCLSIESGCVAVADGTDMAQGRARIPFQKGKTDIHAVSAMAIDEVNVKKGKKKPIQIEVLMSCSAGVFQIQMILEKKVKAASMSDYIEIIAKVSAKERERIVGEIEI